MGDILTLLHERERKNGSVLVAMVPQEEHQVHLLFFFSQVLFVGFFMMRGVAHVFLVDVEFFFYIGQVSLCSKTTKVLTIFNLI